MTATTTSIPAVHDWHLREVLSDLGLLDKVEQGISKCHRCGAHVTFENLGGIMVVGEREFALLCDTLVCLAQEQL